MRHQLLKLAGQAVGAVLATPHLAGYLLARCVMDRNRAFAGASESISRVPGERGVYARQVFYRWTCTEVGRNIHFGFLTLFSKPDIRIGDRVNFGRSCTIGRVDIGPGCWIADGAQVLSGAHHHGQGDTQRDHVAFKRVTLGEGVWIGGNAVVMADVGDGSIVGAGSVVTRPVAAGLTVVGAPARPIQPKAKAA